MILTHVYSHIGTSIILPSECCGWKACGPIDHLCWGAPFSWIHIKLKKEKRNNPYSAGLAMQAQLFSGMSIWGLYIKTLRWLHGRIIIQALEGAMTLPIPIISPKLMWSIVTTLEICSINHQEQRWWHRFEIIPDYLCLRTTSPTKASLL